jgi:hypothetical protein
MRASYTKNDLVCFVLYNTKTLKKKIKHKQFLKMHPLDINVLSCTEEQCQRGDVIVVKESVQLVVRKLNM